MVALKVSRVSLVPDVPVGLKVSRVELVAVSAAALKIARVEMVATTPGTMTVSASAEVAEAGQVVTFTATPATVGTGVSANFRVAASTGPAVGISGSGFTAALTCPPSLADYKVTVGAVPVGSGGELGPEATVTIDVLQSVEVVNINGVAKPTYALLNIEETTAAARVVPLIGKSALPWNSLVFGFGAGTNLATFETWRNRPVDGAVYWPARQTWTDMGQLPTRRAGDLMVFSVPPYPEGLAGGSNANVANGLYDADIDVWAKKLVTAGWNNNKTVIRLGWENNLTSYPWSWSSTTYQTFINAYRHFVEIARFAGLTGVGWNWNLNKGPSSANSSVNWSIAYPGDAYVDVIGIDPYDWYTASTTDAQWTANISGKNPGLQDIATFARAHGKLMSVDEWGMAEVANGGGGDNPFFVQKMLGFVKANADIMAWESYFDNNRGLSSPTTTWPNAAAEYRKAYPNGWGA